MADFDNTAPEAVAIVGQSFADHIADEVLTFDVDIGGDASCTFTTPYAGILRPKPGRTALLSLASVGGVTLDLPPDEWEDGYAIGSGVEVNIRVLGGIAEGFGDEPVSDQASFDPVTAAVSISGVSFDNTSPGEVSITGGSFSNTAPGTVSLSGLSFSDGEAIPVASGGANTVFRGSAPSATLTVPLLKTYLGNQRKTELAGNYFCQATGYKYLVVPVGLGNIASIKDAETDFNVALAGSADGYSSTTSGLHHSTLTVDGVAYRIYRSLYQLGDDITLKVA